MITSEDLIAKVRLASKLPEDDNEPYSDASILSIATDVLYTELIADICSTHDYYYRQVDEQDIDANTFTYRFPSQAVGNGLVDALYRTSTDAVDVYPLEHYTIADKVRPLKRMGFIVTAGGLEIWPRPGSSYTLEVHYLLKPGKLIKAIETSRVTAVDTVNSTIEVATLPAGFTSASFLDVMKSDGMAERVIINAGVDTITGTTISFTDDTLVPNASVGDTVALSGYAPYVQVPDEYISYYVSRICARLGQILGDDQLFGMAEAMSKTTMPKVLNISNPRIQEQLPRISAKWN